MASSSVRPSPRLALRTQPAVSPPFRISLVQEGRSPSAVCGLDGLPPLIGAGLVRLYAQPALKKEKKPRKKDNYQKVKDKIIADLERGELSWLKPWNSGNLEGQIIKPLRHNGLPYNGINVLMLWGASVEAGNLCPHWMTLLKATELGGHVHKGERGNLVVYANTIIKTEETRRRQLQ